MATRVNFGGKQRVIPNTYAEILSGVENPPSALTTGEVLVIDTGGNATWGGGSGVDGEFSQGLESFYRFTSVFWYGVLKAFYRLIQGFISVIMVYKGFPNCARLLSSGQSVTLYSC